MTAPEREDFVLDEQLCFALHTASRAMTGCYRPMLDKIGLTYSQYAVMLVLWERETITLGELGTRLQLDSGTLSPLLKRLESHQLVTRARRPEDERTVQLTLTEAGAALRDEARAAQAVVAEDTGMSLTERARLRDELHALAARLRAAELR
ncbi:hydroperoxide stress response transcriptional regulator OhrR [Rhodococcus aerolatus]